MTKSLNEPRFGLSEVSEQELSAINGGDLGIWGMIGYILGATARGFHEFTSVAAKYQASLPPNLKK